MTVVLASAMAASCVAPRTPPPTSPPAPAPGSTREIPTNPEPIDFLQQVVDAHNARRATAGLIPLVLRPELVASARLHARDMADHRKMSHQGSDGSSPFDRMKRLGYPYQAAAENVAAGYDTVESVMTGWMRNPGHRRNILGKFYEIGAGRAVSRDGVSYWCVTFGTSTTD